MAYQMSPDEEELNREANADQANLSERIERAILADHMFVIAAFGTRSTPGHVVILSRVGEVDTKMLLTLAQARSVVGEILLSIEEIDAEALTRTRCVLLDD